MKILVRLMAVLSLSGVCRAWAEDAKQAAPVPAVASAAASVAPAAQAPASAPPIQAAPAAPAPAAGVSQHVLMAPNEVQWGEPPAGLPPGAQFALLDGDPKTPGAPFTFRVKMPNDYKIPPHVHPGDEHVTVIWGTLNVGMGEKFDRRAVKRLPPGGFAMMPKGMAHFAWALGETIVQVHGVGPWGIRYVDPKDDPRSAVK